MTLGRIEELRKGLPLPGDAFLQHVERNGFDVDEIAHGDLAIRRRHGAIPTPQLPITTLVTPCHGEGVTAASQKICAS
jgi:hypothetical protein